MTSRSDVKYFWPITKAVDCDQIVMSCDAAIVGGDGLEGVGRNKWIDREKVRSTRGHSVSTLMGSM